MLQRGKPAARVSDIALSLHPLGVQLTLTPFYRRAPLTPQTIMYHTEPGTCRNVGCKAGSQKHVIDCPERVPAYQNQSCRHTDGSLQDGGLSRGSFVSWSDSNALSVAAQLLLARKAEVKIGEQGWTQDKLALLQRCIIGED